MALAPVHSGRIASTLGTAGVCRHNRGSDHGRLRFEEEEDEIREYERI